MNEKYQKFLETEFTVFDIETSGLDPLKDEILEIAGIKLKGENELERFEALVQPRRVIPPESEKIHGLNELYLLVNGHNIKNVVNDFLEFTKNSIIVGHNIKEFDWLFILNLTPKLGVPKPENQLIDTLELSRNLLRLPTYNLASVASHFGYKHENAHRAMPDVEINTKVFLRLMDLMLKNEAKK